MTLAKVDKGVSTVHRAWLSLVLAWSASACSDIPTNHDTEENCGCVAERIELSPIGSPVDTMTTIEPCRVFGFSLSPFENVRATSCSMPMTCPSSLTGVTVAQAVRHPDVQMALRAGVVRYGAGPDDLDAGGPVYRLGVGQANFEVAGPCGSAPCTPTPGGVQALLDVLLEVNKQELRRSPCREVLNL